MTSCGASYWYGRLICALPAGHEGVHAKKEIYARRRPGRPRKEARAKSIAPKKLTKAVLRAFDTFAHRDELAIERPKTRGECRDQPRPCPWVGCRHHLYLDVNPETGTIKINFPDREPWELRETCSLDVAERGGMTLEEVGEILNVTRERTRQLEVRGLIDLKTSGALKDAA